MVVLYEGLVAAGIYVPLALAFSVGAAPQAAFNVTSSSVALVGGYVCVALVRSGFGALATLTIAAPLVFFGAIGLHLLVVRPLLRRSNHERSVLVASLGVMAFTEACLALAFGSELATLRMTHAFQSLAEVLNRQTTSWVSGGLLTFMFMMLTVASLRWAPWGMLFRATCDNRRAAVFYRLPVVGVDIASAGLAGVIAWLGVMVFLLTQAATPSMVLTITLWSVTGAILGGMQNPLAACAGGLTLGFVNSVAARTLPHQMLDLFVGAVFVAVLMLRPHGLFLRRGRRA